MKVIGIVLIVFGVLGGVSSAVSKHEKAEAQNLSPAERNSQMIGSALGGLMFVGGGFLLVRWADREAAARERELHEPDDRDDPFHLRKPRPGGKSWDQGPPGSAPGA